MSDQSVEEKLTRALIVIPNRLAEFQIMPFKNLYRAEGNASSRYISHRPTSLPPLSPLFITLISS